VSCFRVRSSSKGERPWQAEDLLRSIFAVLARRAALHAAEQL